MKSNEVLQKDVQDAIKWEPLLHAAEIGVIVKDGIVTLSGTVESFYKKKEAEDAAKNVAGVRAVVDDIEIVIDKSHHRSDTDIAADILKALKDDWSVPDEKIKVTVDNGWVTLDGTLTWDYQREAARKAIRFLSGVRGVNSRLKLKSEVENEVEKKLVEDALRRSWAVDTDKIHVKAQGNTITLSGSVRSIYQKEEAEKIAYKTPGVWFVDNLLQVEYTYEYA